ncbi:MAG: SusD/RagB family nutrient-binding outer membrane lipoprotein [Flammeovirgaceae bacterium]|nr:SusD/RagB family nutrient-binding outer membrane lipoprotein [Flammeovirgaceae bacterium]
MKHFKFIYTAIMILGMASCESFVEGVNEIDPTRPTDADLALVVTGMQVEYMSTLEGEMARLSGLWSGYFTGSDRQYIPIYNYDIASTNSDSPWGNVYAFVFKQSRIAQAKAITLNNRLTLGAAQVVEAHIMGTAATLWGDIPYNEAINTAQFPNPKYDPQDQVIDNLITLLDEAIANLNSGVGNLNGDFLSGGGAPGVILPGSASKWIKVANSLKARYLLYKKDYSGALAAANLGVDVTANNLMAPHGTVNDQNRNIYYDFHQRQRVGYMTAKNAFLAQKLDPASATNRNHANTTETARFNLYYTGTSPNYDLKVSSTGFFGSAASFPLMTAYETKLIAAECETRLNGVTAGVTTLNMHRALLRTAFPAGTYTDFIDADFAPGGIENADSIADADALLREILEEKYVSLYGQIEVFNEIRRTNNAVGVPPNSGTQMPQRFLYSQNEINSNTSTPSPIPGLFVKTTLFQ